MYEQDTESTTSSCSTKMVAEREAILFSNLRILSFLNACVVQHLKGTLFLSVHLIFVHFLRFFFHVETTVPTFTDAYSSSYMVRRKPGLPPQNVSKAFQDQVER